MGAVKTNYPLLVEVHHIITIELMENQSKLLMESQHKDDDPRNGILLSLPFHKMVGSGDIELVKNQGKYVLPSHSTRSLFLDGRPVMIANKVGRWNMSSDSHPSISIRAN